jgi:DNA primase
MIEQESIEQLKTRLDIVDVIGRYIELKKAGANFKANCPFHDENTASFVVSPSKQIYKCFGCGVGGDSIGFVMEYEKLNYAEAIEKLANEYNVELRYTKGQKSIYQRSNLLEELNQYFRRVLQNTPQAKEYLLNRGVYESSIEKFELGYAPSSKESLDFLRSLGVKVSEGMELGILAKSADGRVYARFTNRITFPIFNPSGKIVGFGGRIITNRDDIGKYINSPDTKIFDKSTLLYGYHKARDTIMKKGRVIVVEGNLDVVMLHQAGWTNSVATLGTAMTERVVPLLRRGEPEVIVAYDGDSAGVKAAFKAASMLSRKGVSGGVVIFAEGKDPADMVKDGEVEELKRLFNSSTPFVEFCFDHIVSNFDLNNPLEKERALKEGVNYLKTLSPILQEEYRGYLAAILNVDERYIRVSKAKNPDKNFSNKTIHEDIAELNIIKTLLSNPSQIDKILDIISIDIFKTHKREFELLIGNEVDDPLLIGIEIRDDIIEYEGEELMEQIRFLLRRHYESELKKIKNLKDISFEKKSFYVMKIRDIIERLKKGETVAYESFGTF